MTSRGSLATCWQCGKNLHAAAGFVELRRQPSGEQARLCSIGCLLAWAEEHRGEAA